jgi:hypothetical protein
VVKRLEFDAERSPPSSAEIKNEWSYTFTPLYAFIVYRHTTLCVHRHVRSSLLRKQVSFHRNQFIFISPDVLQNSWFTCFITGSFRSTIFIRRQFIRRIFTDLFAAIHRKCRTSKLINGHFLSVPFQFMTHKHHQFLQINCTKYSASKVILFPLSKAWRGPEGSSRLRLPDFKTIST